jgi:hypothetical protein
MSLAPTFIREFRGISKLDPFSIANGFATDGYNFSTAQYPALTTRPGYSLLGAAIARVLGLGVHKETTLLAAFADGSIRSWSGSAWTSLATGLNTSAPWSWANFKGGFADIYLLAANGVDAVKQYNGSTVSNLSGPPSGLNYIEQYADRVWGIVGNTLHASGYRLTTDWTSTPPADQIDDSVSFNTVIESPDGETISGLRAGLGRLVVFKPSAMYELQGYAPSDYRVDMISNEIGAINNRCIAVLQSGMYHLDERGLYRYRGDGVAPNKTFSQPIQWYIDNMNKSAKQTFSLGTDGRFLFVSISMSSSTQPDTLLVYDPDYNAWSVWTGHAAVAFANLGVNTYLGDYGGTVRLLGGNTDAGAAIIARWVSRPFTAPSLAQVIRWMRLWSTMDLPSGSSFSTWVSPTKDGNDFVAAGVPVSGSGAIVQRPVYFPPGQLPLTACLRMGLDWTGPCTIHETAFDQHTMPLR